MPVTYVFGMMRPEVEASLFHDETSSLKLTCLSENWWLLGDYFPVWKAYFQGLYKAIYIYISFREGSFPPSQER